MKREIRQQILADKLLVSDKLNGPSSDHIDYGLGKGALIPKVYRRTIDNWKNKR